MDGGGASSERTPLVRPAPAYVYRSTASRSLSNRLQTFQCCLCVSLLAILGVALLISVSFTLDEQNRESNESEADRPSVLRPEPAIANLTLSFATFYLDPMLNITWPRPDSEVGPVVGDATPPDAAALASAEAAGTAALAALQALEAGGAGAALAADSPAGRAQAAVATARRVQPLAHTAYASEHAVRALARTAPRWCGGACAGRGVRVTGPWPRPPYCSEAPPPRCPRSPYRTVDGSCNNLRHPLRWGVAFTPFRRALPPDYADGVSAPRTGAEGSPLPSARQVSLTVHRPTYSNDSSFTVMLAVWGQFLDHDITATAISKGGNGTSLACCGSEMSGVGPHPECFPVRLAPADPFYHRYNLTCMEFVRAAPAPTCFYGPREQMNQVTSFIDGSAIYGATEKLMRELRAHVGGRLRMLRLAGRDLLPQSTDPDDGCNTHLMNEQGKYCFMAGDARANENLHLTTMHLLWARQHNLVAAALQTANPQWDDEQLFQTARKIIGAQLQHITYNEFLPVVLGSDVLEILNMSVHSGRRAHAYDASVDPSAANHFAAAAFRFAHTLLPGLIHATDSETGSEDDVLLHEMLFNPYSLYSARGPELALSSAMINKVNRVRAHVTDELSDHLFERTYKSANGTLHTHGPCGLDLVSLNIQRGRDHGLPAYPAWRDHCGLGRPKNWEDLSDVFDANSLERIRSIYNTVEDVDLYTGALSEEPGERLLGPTLTCLLADQFLRLKIGDRFWYETNDPTVGFNEEQLAEIRKTSLAGVICANAGGLLRSQPRVMQAVDTNNPLLDCEKLPQPDLMLWQTLAPRA